MKTDAPSEPRVSRRDVFRYAGLAGVVGFAGFTGLSVSSQPAIAAPSGTPTIASGLHAGTHPVNSYDIEHSGLDPTGDITIIYEFTLSNGLTKQDTHSVSISRRTGTTATGAHSITVPSGQVQMRITVSHKSVPTQSTVESPVQTVYSQVNSPGTYWVEALSNFKPDLVKLSTAYDWTTEVSKTTLSFLPVRTTVSFRPDGRRLYALTGRTDATATQYDLPSPFDVNNATQTASASIKTNNRFEQVIFSPDGRRMYTNQGDTTGSGSDDNITQYTVNTPWDLGGGISEDFTVSMPPSLANGIGAITFNTDGTRLYYGSRNHGRTIYQSELSTAFDVGTVSSTASLDTGYADPLAVQLSTDGTALYVAHHSPDYVFQWDLSTAFDVTTAQNRTTLRGDVENNTGLYSHIPPHYTQPTGY